VAVLTLGGCITFQATGRAPDDDTGLLGDAVAIATPGTTPAPTVRPEALRTTRPTTSPNLAAVTAATPSPDTSVRPSFSVAASASPAPTATPRRTPRPDPTPRLRPRPRKGPFRMNLYRRGDFVSEFTAWYCLPAAMQTMINIMERGRPDRTRATQDRLYRLARRYSSEKLWGRGAEPIGWARALRRLGYGEWRVVGYRRRADAIRIAARALRMTGRPVGLLTWRGAHSWVMSGFASTADPALTGRYRVTSVVIQDVWYPRVSSIWGASDPPNTAVPVQRLGRDYLPYRRPLRRYPGLDGRYVLVLPVVRG
jgi:hypothetical protein